MFMSDTNVGQGFIIHYSTEVVVTYVCIYFNTLLITLYKVISIYNSMISLTVIWINIANTNENFITI